jgi:hypothetical protein
MEKHQVQPENAQCIWEWLTTRGGLAIWNCLDLSRAGQTWTAPINDENGKPKAKPHWAAGQIIRVITDPEEVEIVVPREAQRFHVATRMGSQGLSIKVTDGGTRRIKAAVAKAKEQYGDAWYEFDYGDYKNAVILVPDRRIPISQYLLDATKK